MNLFTISILCHNQLEHTRRCLESVARTSHDYHAVVVDNASTDDTLLFLRAFCADHPEFGIFCMEENAGFIKGHNKALEFARGSYFVVLNNDVEVCDGWLDKMRAEFIADPKLALCGVRGMCNALAPSGHGYLDTDPDRLDYVEASCLMIPTWLARKEGLFPTELRFGYAEDSWLSLRMREKGLHLKAIDLPIKHERFATYRETQHEIDLEGFQAVNHAILRNRFGYYFRKGNFQYTIGVRRSGARGDVLLVTPLLRQLKKRYGCSLVTAYTDHRDVLARNPNIDAPVQRGDAFDPRNHDIAIDLDLHYERDPKKHIIQAYGEAAEIEIENWRPESFPAPEDRAWAKSEMSNSGDCWAVLHAGPTAWQGRNWSVDNFVAVSQELTRLGWFVANVGEYPSALNEFPCHLDMRNRTSYHRLYALIERAKLFVGLDSLPFHIAQATMTPSVAVFGCINPEYRCLPWPYIVPVKADGLGCLGCHHDQIAPRVDSHCLRERLLCMERVSVNMVMDAITRALEAKMPQQETSKIRERALPYCEGQGVDIGCGRDKIRPEAIGIDDEDYPEVNVLWNCAGLLPFDFESMDYVYSSHALEDMVDPLATLECWAKSLRRGGTLVLYVPHPDLYKGCNLEHKFPGFRPHELAAMLEPLCFEIVDSYIDNDPAQARYSTFIAARKL